MQPIEAKQKDDTAKAAKLRRHRVSLRLTDDELYRLGYLCSGPSYSYSSVLVRLINVAYTKARAE